MKLLSLKILPKSYLNEETSSLTNSISSIFFWMRLEFEETSSVFFWMRFESSVMFLAITSINHLFWFLRAAFSSRMSSMLLEEDSEILLLFFFESSEISCSKRQWKYDWVKVFHSLKVSILTHNPLSKKGGGKRTVKLEEIESLFTKWKIPAHALVKVTESPRTERS